MMTTKAIFSSQIFQKIHTTHFNLKLVAFSYYVITRAIWWQIVRPSSIPISTLDCLVISAFRFPTPLADSLVSLSHSHILSYPPIPSIGFATSGRLDLLAISLPHCHCRHGRHFCLIRGQIWWYNNNARNKYARSTAITAKCYRNQPRPSLVVGAYLAKNREIATACSVCRVRVRACCFLRTMYIIQRGHCHWIRIDVGSFISFAIFSPETENIACTLCVVTLLAFACVCSFLSFFFSSFTLFVVAVAAVALHCWRENVFRLARKAILAHATILMEWRHVHKTPHISPPKQCCQRAPVGQISGKNPTNPRLSYTQSSIDKYLGNQNTHTQTSNIESASQNISSYCNAIAIGSSQPHEHEFCCSF